MTSRRIKKKHGVSIRTKAFVLFVIVFLYAPAKYIFLAQEIDELGQALEADERAVENVYTAIRLEKEARALVDLHDNGAKGDDWKSEYDARVGKLASALDELIKSDDQMPPFPDSSTFVEVVQSSAMNADNPAGADAIEHLRAVSDEIHDLQGTFVEKSMSLDQSVSLHSSHMLKTARLSLLIGLAAAGVGAWLIFNSMLRPLTTIRSALVAAGRDPENAEKYLVDVRGSSDVAETIEAMNMLLLQVSSGLEDIIASENRLRTRSRELRVILDNVIDGIVTADTKGRILSFNASAEDMFGYSADQVIGQNLKILMPEEYAKHHDQYMQDYLETGHAKIIGIGSREVTAIRADGTTFPAELSVSEASPGGQRIFVGAVRDISDQVEARDQFARTNRMDAIGKMTGGLAHDFNNMLTVVSGNLEMIIDMAEDEENEMIVSLAKTAEKAAERGADLTQRLLTFSRKQDLKPVDTNLNETIPDAVELIKRGLKEDVALEIVLQEGLWPVCVDRSLLDNALINLSFNARDAMPDGGSVRIMVENVTLDERFAADLPEITPGEYVRISVQDTGTGIPPEVLEHVYEPFFSTKEAGKGTGLGLSMVYGFIRQSGGAIYIDSVPGKGTTVNLLLPHRVSNTDLDPEQPLPVDEAQAGNTEMTGQGVVLVVEDDHDLREHVVRLLEVSGYTVFQADSGPAAIELLPTLDKLDLLLSDVVMPGGMNGEEVAEYVTDKMPETAVLFMSGYTRDALMKDGRIKEGIRLVQKPFTRRKLMGMVSAVLSENVQSGTGAQDAGS